MVRRSTQLQENLQAVLEDPEYDPERLLREVSGALNVKNQASLSKVLGYDSAVLGRVMKKQVTLSPGLILAILEHTGMTLGHVYERAGLLKHLGHVRHAVNRPAGLFKWDQARAISGLPPMVHMQALSEGGPGVFPLYYSTPDQPEE